MSHNEKMFEKFRLKSQFNWKRIKMFYEDYNFNQNKQNLWQTFKNELQFLRPPESLKSGKNYFKKAFEIISVIFFECMFMQFTSFLFTSLLVYLMLYTNYYWITALYITWYIYDINICYKGGRPTHWMRELRLWKYFCQYFPMKLIKTAELSPANNYIFPIHPHGIMCVSGFGNFCTEGTGFSQLFPGLNVHVLALKWLFYLPFTREILIFQGASAVTKESFLSILRNKEKLTEKKGQICLVCVGGAAESLESHPDTYRLILKNRMGFIRMALKTGASLVPVFSFGENDVFKQLPNPKHSRVWKVQNFIKSWTAIGPAFWHGKGLIEESFGFIAFRKPIYTVVGKPITVVKNEKPTVEEVNELHEIYVTNLRELFDTHKATYCSDRSIDLEII